MKLQEMHKLDDEALRGRLDEMKKDLVHLRLKASMGQLGNPKEIKSVKKDVARVLTILNERKNKAQAGGEA